MSTSEEAEAHAWLIKNGIIPRPHDPYDWTHWTRTFRIFPRKSINGKILWGMMNKRKRAYDEHFFFTDGQRVYKYQHQYATKKEIFETKLKGDYDEQQST